MIKTLSAGISIAAMCASSVSALLNESFDELLLGPVSNQSTWVLEGGVSEVQTNIVEKGKAVLLSVASMPHDLEANNSALWTTFWSWYEAAPSQDELIANENSSAVFFINTNPHLVVYSKLVTFTSYSK